MRIVRWSQSVSALAAVGAVLAAVNCARADHGPGTSGGGASTQSGETLKRGKFSIELRTDYTEFENLLSGEIAAKAAKAGGFDLRWLRLPLRSTCAAMPRWQAPMCCGNRDI